MFGAYTWTIQGSDILDLLQELQEIVRGRGGSTSLLKSFKPEAVQKTVQKGIVAPLTSSPQKATLAKPAATSGTGECSLQVPMSVLPGLFDLFVSGSSASCSWRRRTERRDLRRTWAPGIDWGSDSQQQQKGQAGSWQGGTLHLCPHVLNKSYLPNHM